jgi:hypothetical protein
LIRFRLFVDWRQHKFKAAGHYPWREVIANPNAHADIARVPTFEDHFVDDGAYRAGFHARRRHAQWIAHSAPDQRHLGTSKTVPHRLTGWKWKSVNIELKAEVKLARKAPTSRGAGVGADEAGYLEKLGTADYA